MPPTEADRLDALFRDTGDRKLRDRLQTALFAHRGRPHRDIAADLGLNWTSPRLVDTQLTVSALFTRGHTDG